MFRSCFVIDVQTPTKDGAVLLDSTGHRWHVDMSDAALAAGFKAWFKGTFLAGVAQTLTVFEYETRGTPPENENWIVKFYCQDRRQVNG